MRPSTIRYIWLAIAGILSLVACGDTVQTTRASPSPIPTGATATVGAPTAPATPESFFSVQQYATTCGRLVVLQDETYEQFLNVNKVGSQEHWDWYVEWSDMVLALRPPPELADFHEARADFYSSEVEHEGPNRWTRAAFIRELGAVDAMPDDLREILLEAGCLDEGRISAGRENLAVIERVATRGPAPDPPTVEDYADRCHDVWLAVPLFDSHDAYLEHYFTGMDSLTPPPELQEFHRHLVGKLRRMFAQKDSYRPTVEIARLATRHSGILSPQLYSSLVDANCIPHDPSARPRQPITSILTPIPSPSPATTGQAATATPVPTTTPQATADETPMTESQYAKACGEIMTVDLTDMDTGAYADWVESFAALSPPESLVGYHHAVLHLFRTKLDPNRDELDSRTPYLRLMFFMLEMDGSHGRLLEAESCTLRVDVEVGQVIGDTRARVVSRKDLDQPMTLRQFAIGCADMRLSAPWLDDMDVIGTYLFEHWSKLNPPQDMQHYHEAMRLFYEEWAMTGEMDFDTHRGREALEAGRNLPPHILETLLRSGCVGGFR